MTLVVVGATGAVGTEILKILEERGHADAEVVAVASRRSAGRKLPFAGRQLVVVAFAEDVFSEGDIALLYVPDPVPKELSPMAAVGVAAV